MDSRSFVSAVQRLWLSTALFFCSVLLIACSEPVPRTPTVHVTADSVHVWLDEQISYSNVTLLFGHDAQAYYPQYGSHNLRDGGKHVLPLQQWTYFDSEHLQYHGFWHSEKPECAWLNFETPGDVSGSYLWYWRDGAYRLLSKWMGKNGAIIDSLSQACPDSLMPLLDRAVLTFSDGSCTLPPWPEEEDSATASAPPALVFDSMNVATRHLIQLPPGNDPRWIIK